MTHPASTLRRGETAVRPCAVSNAVPQIGAARRAGRPALGLVLIGALALLAGCQRGEDGASAPEGKVRRLDLSTLALVTTRGAEQRTGASPAPDIEAIAREEESPRVSPTSPPPAVTAVNAVPETVARESLRVARGG